jgi:hypothetical protein
VKLHAPFGHVIKRPEPRALEQRASQSQSQSLNLNLNLNLHLNKTTFRPNRDRRKKQRK